MGRPCRDQASDLLAPPGDDDLLPPLDLVEQLAQLVLCLEGPNRAQEYFPASQYKLA
jgi:hypothetical protein